MKEVVCCGVLLMLWTVPNLAAAEDAKSDAYRNGVSSFENGDYDGCSNGFHQRRKIVHRRVAVADEKHFQRRIAHLTRCAARAEKQGNKEDQSAMDHHTGIHGLAYFKGHQLPSLRQSFGKSAFSIRIS